MGPHYGFAFVTYEHGTEKWRSREMRNAFMLGVLGVTDYSGNSRCGKVFERV